LHPHPSDKGFAIPEIELSVVYNDKYSLSSEDDSIETETKYGLQTQNNVLLLQTGAT